MDLLKQLERSDNDGRFVSLLAEFISKFFLRGEGPSFVLDHLLGGEIIGLKASETKIRPIAMTNSYRKIAEKFLLSQVNGSKLFSGVQLGVGTRFGAEKMINMCRWGLEANPTWDYSASDFKEAFQRISRAEVLERIEELAPEFLPMKSKSLPLHQKLYYCGCEEGVTSVSCHTGVQQGAPSSPLDFALGSITLCREVQKIVQESDGLGWFRAYADDARLMGTSERVLQAILHQTTKGAYYGLELQQSKHKVLLGKCDSLAEARVKRQALVSLNIPEDHIIIHPHNLPETAHLYGDIIMGIPIGSDEFCRNYIDSLIEDMKAECQQLLLLNDYQLLFTFLRQIWPHKMTYFLRNLPPSLSRGIVTCFQECQRLMLAKVAGVPSIDDMSFFVSCLNTGGLGLGFTEDIVDAAYVAALVSALPELELTWKDIRKTIALCYQSECGCKSIQEFCQAVRRLHSGDSSITLEKLLDLPVGKLGKLQCSLGKRRKANRFKVFIGGLRNPTLRSIFLSGATQEASAWTRAVPRTREFRFSNEEFAVAIRNRLLLQHPGIVHKGLCPCGVDEVDPFGLHLQKCKRRNHLTIATHDAIKFDLRDLCVQSGLHCQMEVHKDPELAADGRIDLHVRRPDNSEVAIDVCVTNAAQRNKSSQTQGHQASAMEAKKFERYGAQLSKNDVDFFPFVLEVQGLWGEQAISILSQLLALDTKETDVSLSQKTLYWKTRISCTLQRHVARSILIRNRSLGHCLASSDITEYIHRVPRSGFNIRRRAFVS